MKSLPRSLLIGGVIVCLGAPLAGLAVTVGSMVLAFQQLNASGIVDAEALAHHVSRAMLATMAGLTLSVAAGVPMMIAGLLLHTAARKPAPAS